MFDKLDRANPRLHILLELGAEARLGQVSRSMRSNLSLGGGWFQAFEGALDIPHVEGRGWYVRLKAADLAENAVNDPRALNHVTGHADTKTRRGYQSLTNEVRVLAVSAREANRNRPQIVPELVPRAKDLVQVRTADEDNAL